MNDAVLVFEDGTAVQVVRGKDADSFSPVGQSVWVDAPIGSVVAGMIYDGNVFTAPTPAEQSQEELDAENTLSSVRFRWMLAKNGWIDVWDGVEAWVKTNDAAMFAVIYAQKGSSSFRLSVTLSFLNRVRPLLGQLYPKADLSESAVRKAWAEAKAVNLAE